MRVRKLLSFRLRTTILVAMILALPVIPVNAAPCDADRLDLASLHPQHFEVVVAMDDAWQQAYEDRAEAAAHQLIVDVNQILEPAGIRLTVADYRMWVSQDSEPTMSGLLQHLDSSIPAQRGQFVIGLTGRQLSQVDGMAHTGHVHLVARRHPGRQQLDALVVAHEIGHLLGAKHHTCDHDYTCVMAPKGFGLPARWCDHHVLEMQLGAARLFAE